MIFAQISSQITKKDFSKIYKFSLSEYNCYFFIVKLDVIASARASACSWAVSLSRAAWCPCVRGRSCIGTGFSTRGVPRALLHLFKMNLSRSSLDGITKNPRQIHYLQLLSCFVICLEVRTSLHRFESMCTQKNNSTTRGHINAAGTKPVAAGYISGGFIISF